MKHKWLFSEKQIFMISHFVWLYLDCAESMTVGVGILRYVFDDFINV